MKKALYRNPQLLRLHWRRGTLTYLLALLIIGVLALLSHYLVQSIVNQQEASARIVNLAGRQRMLSQRITLFAGQLLAEKMNARRPCFRGISGDCGNDEKGTSGVDVWFNADGDPRAKFSRRAANFS
ncbi:type IV pili methyl-accepting chemotaxis transducer N-terminal domain-containing protein [Shewanella dokdonensis]|uniref:Type IV pili methyl-accepting chemotaxis transducer N-terminal domain-containing protein n=1 Tax=Shewanella dokdonensis TaxID=712036 RepID=A0ABX8DJF0_9GAMM|nr:type IV pili methyl-accepting chemotaxis transducer N-terminal domain-containing protein [Shewanella dokdonensis]QVK24654.1 type IV pili methyl-accepting chemotaxis transducer N-terminal domain-containing protein [Shewanella dokdonensis]